MFEFNVSERTEYSRIFLDCYCSWCCHKICWFQTILIHYNVHVWFCLFGKILHRLNVSFCNHSGFARFEWAHVLNEPRQANLVLIAYASSEGSGEPAHPRSLTRTSAARSYKQWVNRNLQTESQILGPSEWLGMRGLNLSLRNARRHKFAWRGPNVFSFNAEKVTIITLIAVQKRCLTFDAMYILVYSDFFKIIIRSDLYWKDA